SRNRRTGLLPFSVPPCSTSTTTRIDVVARRIVCLVIVTVSARGQNEPHSRLENGPKRSVIRHGARPRSCRALAVRGSRGEPRISVLFAAGRPAAATQLHARLRQHPVYEAV